MAKKSRRNVKQEAVQVERIQLGVRIEKRLAKVLKGIAEYADMSLGEIIEDIVLHAFEGECTFSDPKARSKIKELKKVYELDYGVHASYRFVEKGA